MSGKKRPRVRKWYEREASKFDTGSEGGANQSQKNMANINNIIGQYISTGSVTHVSKKEPLYGDFAAASDLHTALNRVHAAQEHFESLDARIRAVAANDPVEFLAMVDDPEGRKVLQEAGLEFDDSDFVDAEAPAGADLSSPTGEQLPPDEAEEGSEDPDGAIST